MSGLKVTGVVVAVIIALVVLFCAIVGITSSVNGITFYEQLRAWFGSGSAIGGALGGGSAQLNSIITKI